MRQTTSGQPILVVEDSDDDYEVTERALLRSGNIANPLARCRTGNEALDYLLQQGPYAEPDAAPRPALILLDLNMPGLDGRGLLTRIKSDYDLREIPVVVLTTSDDERDVNACYELGANSYIRKPVDLDGFYSAIKTMRQFWFEIALLPKENGT